MTAFTEHPASERLSGYLDGDLAASEREPLARHLERCAACAATLAELTRVRDQARALPPLAAPDRVWAGIEARLAGAPRVVDLAAHRERRRWSFTTPQLAAAAAALMVVSGSVAWLAGQYQRPGAPRVETPVLAARPLPPPSGDTTAPAPADVITPGPVAEPPSAALARALEPRAARRAPAGKGLPAAAANFGVERYDTAIADLERLLAQNRSRLSPATVQVVEKNLALIDAAIEDARRALAADPASPYLNDHLAATMKRKVDLLRQVTSRLQS